MPAHELWTILQDWEKVEIEFDSSFEAVCLFSFTGIILSLVFLLTVVPALDAGLTLTQLP